MPLNTEAVKQMLADRADAILSDLAERGADIVQNNARRDTGFMRDTTNAIPPNSSGPGGLSEVRNSKWAGGPAFRFSANGVHTGEHESAIHVPAIYAFWVELRDPFLVPAAQQVIAESDGIVAKHKI